MRFDAIVLGAGPAGLGAALALVRAGARAALIDGAEQVGGLSRTLHREPYAFDLGGHVLFVHDSAREAWLRELLGPDLVRIERPVAALSGGRVTPGRYLDRRADGLGAPPHELDVSGSAATMLTSVFGADVVDRHMRRYLEKVDGMPLEQITATRVRKLMVEQYAPDGFWFAHGGAGTLMEAMARAIRAGGGEVALRTHVEAIRHHAGRVTQVEAFGLDGRPLTFRAPLVVAAIPPAQAAALVSPAPPEHVVPDLPPRAAAIVALTVATPRVTDEPWIQVDRSDVPFARLAEMPNWSARMAPPGHTVLVCEVYCHPHADDRWWPLEDDALGRACAAALIDPLQLVDAGLQVSTLAVVRLARAWSLVAVDTMADAQRPAEWLADLRGFVGAQGGDVISAIDAGERAAASALVGGAA